ncbi:MAG: short-chain dehydrogenase [Chloroflexota bacterium]|nr:MAG: short-chain dehydrogenase [Chloroflexota bacterium]
MKEPKLLTGKIYLVTGATAGIGKVTASALAGQGAQLVVHGRNKAKTEETVQEIKASTGNQQVSYLLADFSDLDQVRTLAKNFQDRYQHLHLLVNNAGGFFNKRTPTPYGVELTFLVNHLAPFLLTNLLLDTLKNSAPSRIINVSSEAHRQDQMDFENLDFKKGYFGIKAYARSKLANILFTYQLARRLVGTGVTVNALHPGHIATDIWKTNFGLIGHALKRIMGLFSLTPEEGAENSIFLAASPSLEGVNGKYFIKNEPAQSSPVSYDEETARRLWDVSADLTSLPEN